MSRWARSITILGLLAGCGGTPPPAGDDGSGSGDASSGDASTSGSTAAMTGAMTGAGTNAGTGTGSTTTSTTEPTTADETASAPFEHDVYTLLTDAGRLALHSNLPPAVDDCLALPFSDPPCDDADLDGLVDTWEDAVLERLRPLRRFDEEESIIGDPAGVMADVGRVTLAADGTYRLMVMLGYHYDYGSCGFTSHNGDSERVVLADQSFCGGLGGTGCSSSVRSKLLVDPFP